MHLIFNVVYQTFENKIETITAVKNIDVLRQYTSNKTEINNYVDFHNLGAVEFKCHGGRYSRIQGN